MEKYTKKVVSGKPVEQIIIIDRICDNCSKNSIPNGNPLTGTIKKCRSYGYGEGWNFRRFTKECPGFIAIGIVE